MKRSLREYLSTHAELRNEIQAKVGRLPGVNPEPDEDEHSGDEDEPLHSSEVPLFAVVLHEFGLVVDERPGPRGNGMVSVEDIEARDGILVGASTGDIWKPPSY